MITKKILFLILVSVAISGCYNNKIAKSSSKNIETPVVDSAKDLPDWILNPYIKNGVAAVGMAYPIAKNQSEESQILIAENEARAEISEIIHAKLSRIEKDILAQINFENPSQAKKIFDEATAEVVQSISTTKAARVDSYKDKDGTLYVHLFLKNKDYKKSAKRVQEIYQNHVDKSHLKNGDLEKANEVVQALFGYSKHHYWLHRSDLH